MWADEERIKAKRDSGRWNKKTKRRDITNETKGSKKIGEEKT